MHFPNTPDVQLLSKGRCKRACAKVFKPQMRRALNAVNMQRNHRQKPELMTKIWKFVACNALQGHLMIFSALVHPLWTANGVSQRQCTSIYCTHVANFHLAPLTQISQRG